MNDGAAALIIASEAAAKTLRAYADCPHTGWRGRRRATSHYGHWSCTGHQEVCARLGLTPAEFEVIELNEAFGSQAIAVLRDLGIPEDAIHVNPNGGAIALGHPLGMSGVRITGTAALELTSLGKTYALATMCIGVGQGIAIALQRV